MEKIKKKVIVVGEPSVGKTTLTQMYCSNGAEFRKEYLMTQVSDIASKIVSLEDDKDVELFFFDLSGKELYRNPVNKLMKSADFCIYVYDSTNQDSFTQIKEWATLVKKNAGKNLPGLLVSTKNDLTSLKTVESRTGQDAASKLEVQFYEFNPQNYQGLDEALGSLGRKSI